MALVHERAQALGTLDVAPVIGPAGDRLHARHRDGMARRHTAQRAAGQHTDDDDADATLPRALEQAPEVLGREPRRHLDAGARVEQVVADLRGVERRRVEHPVEGPGVAERRDAPEARLPLRLQSLERGNHLADHGAHADRARAALADDVVVELEQVHVREAEAPEARVERAADRPPHVLHVRGVEADLRADVDRHAERLQRRAEVLLRLAVTVERRGVEVVDAELDRTRDGTLPLGGAPADHEPADVPAAEPEGRHAQPRPTQRSILHAFLLNRAGPPRPRASSTRSARRSSASARRTGRAGVGSSPCPPD